MIMFYRMLTTGVLFLPAVVLVPANM